MLWVEMEVNSGAVKHMVELIWCVDEVDDTTLADLHDIWWFWWRLQTRYIHLGRRLVYYNFINGPTNDFLHARSDQPG